MSISNVLSMDKEAGKSDVKPTLTPTSNAKQVDGPAEKKSPSDAQGPSPRPSDALVPMTRPSDAQVPNIRCQHKWKAIAAQTKIQDLHSSYYALYTCKSPSLNSSASKTCLKNPNRFNTKNSKNANNLSTSKRTISLQIPIKTRAGNVVRTSNVTFMRARVNVGKSSRLSERRNNAGNLLRHLAKWATHKVKSTERNVREGFKVNF